jgi:alpha-beta hydrolase superfamily lysophospholipase
VKKIKIIINKLLSNQALIIFSIFFLVMSIGFLIYKKTFYKKAMSARKLRIFHDYRWYQDQEKYLNGRSITPVAFTSKRNALSDENSNIVRDGCLCIKKNAPATILICHGFMATKDDVAFIRHIFDEYNVFTFDFRAHGERSTDQHCTLGQDEKYDVIGAVKFLKEHPILRNKPIIVYGFSMGAVASILAIHEDKKLFDAAIWDCPFDSTNDLINRAFGRIKIPLFGYEFNLPGLFVLKKYAYHKYVQKVLLFVLKHIAKFDATKIFTIIEPISTKDAIKDVKIPMFLIACHNDDKAPPSAVMNIYNNAKETNFKRFWIAGGRKHFDAFFANPEKYIYKIRSFVKSFLNKSFLNKKTEKIKEDPCIYQYS